MRLWPGSHTQSANHIRDCPTVDAALILLFNVYLLLQVRESQSQELKANLTSPVARFSITGLEAGAHYQAGLFSYNTKGRSEPVVLQAATLRLPEKQLTAEKGI